VSACHRCGFDPDHDPSTLVTYRGRRQRIVGSYALAPGRTGKYHGKAITLVCVVEQKKGDPMTQTTTPLPCRNHKTCGGYAEPGHDRCACCLAAEEEIKAAKIEQTLKQLEKKGAK
jgi:hypothetical protein